MGDGTDKTTASSKVQPFKLPEEQEPETPATAQDAATERSRTDTDIRPPEKRTAGEIPPSDAVVEPKQTFTQRALDETQRRAEKAEATPAKPISDLEWRTALNTSMTGLLELKLYDLQIGALKDRTDAVSVVERMAKQKERDAKVEEIDKSFQVALKDIQTRATDGDTSVLRARTSAEKIVEEKTAVLAKLKGLGFNSAAELQGDNLKTTILTDAVRNGSDTPAQKLLTHLAVLEVSLEDTLDQASQAISRKQLPFRVAMEYANFVCKERNGVYNDSNDGNRPKTALDLLKAVTTAEMIARKGDVAIDQATKQEAKNISEVVDKKDNPMIALLQARAEKDPVRQLEQLRHAAFLADQKAVSPEVCQRKIAELKDQLLEPAVKADVVKAHELEVQMTAWESLSHSRGLTNAVLAGAILEKEPPDFAAARDTLLKAGKDPIGAQNYRDALGQPLFSTMMLVALAGEKVDMQALKEGRDVESLKTIQTQISDAATLAAKAAQKSEAANNQPDEAKRAALLNEAIALGNQSIQQAHALTKAFGGQDKEALQKQLDLLKQKPEAERTVEEKQMLGFLEGLHQLAGMEAATKVSVASWNTALGNGAAAEAMLKDVEQNHPEFFDGKDDVFRNQYKEMKDVAHSVAVDREIDEMHSANPWKYCRRLGKWATDNWKMVAFGTACIVAAGIVGICTLGAGAPVSAGIIAWGIGAGMVAGTLTGGALQYASGKESFGVGCVKALPYAASGAVVGAGIGATAGGFLVGAATPTFWGVTATGAKLGFAGGSLWNIGSVAEGYQKGRYDHWHEAATDYGTGVAAWTAGGALAGGSAYYAVGGLAGIAGGGTKAAIAWNVGKVGLNSAALIGTKPLTDSGHNLLNFGVAKATGTMPRYAFQGALNMTDDMAREQKRLYLENLAAPKAKPEVKVVAPQVEEKSTYDPEKGVDLKSFLK